MPSPEPAYDAFVIGSGSGGLTVAIGLAELGRRVALIEAARVGGDCTNVGCVPSKRLIHLSRDPALRADSARVPADVRATRDRLATTRCACSPRRTASTSSGAAPAWSPGAA